MYVSEPPGSERRREWRGRRLYRSRTNRMVAGVCGGLSEFIGFDASLIRLLWLLWIFLGGSGLIVYLIFAIIVPERPVGEAVELPPTPAYWDLMGRNGLLLVGVAIVVIGAVLLLNALGLFPYSLGYLWHTFWKVFWPIALISLGILILVGAFWREGNWWRNVRMPAPGAMLQRARHQRVIAGVCAGIGHFLDLDPSLVRVLWVLGTLATAGTGIIAYIIAAIVLPEEPL